MSIYCRTNVLPVSLRASVMARATTNHHDDDGHGAAAKHHLYDIAAWLWPYVSHVHLDGYRLTYLDAMMKVYALRAGQAVAAHEDVNETDAAGNVSLLSVLVFLNDGFTGGTTRFANGVSVTGEAGELMVFEHALRHECTPILTGCKYVLKSDLFFDPAMVYAHV